MVRDGLGWLDRRLEVGHLLYFIAPARTFDALFNDEGLL